MTSYLISKEQCPKCASNGGDTRRDNCAVYSDGHKHCFKCGYTKGGKYSIFKPVKKEVKKSYAYREMLA